MDEITLRASAMLGGAVGFLASVLGLVSWQRKIAIQDTQREMLQQQVLQRLDEMMKIEKTLAEVLNHPGDSQFSVSPVLQNQQEMIATLKRIEEHLRPR
jgi:hypothetical protein